MQVLLNILTVIEVIVCLFLVLIVLMQRPRQEGLGAAFGGDMASQMWGAQTTNVLQKFTVYLAIALFVLTVTLAVLTTRVQQGKHRDIELGKGKPPVTAPPAAPTLPTPGMPAIPLPGAGQSATIPVEITPQGTTTTTADGKTVTVQKQPGATVKVTQPAAKSDAKPADAKAADTTPAAPAATTPPPPIKLNSAPAPASQTPAPAAPAEPKPVTPPSPSAPAAATSPATPAPAK